MGMTKDGIRGERLSHWLASKKSNDHFQTDLHIKKLVLPNNEVVKGWSLLEVKYQEYFEEGPSGNKYCPFDGTGLKHKKIESRLNFEKDTNIPAYFLVFEKDYLKSCGDRIWIARLKKLNNQKYFDTEGEHKRRVYPLKNFQSYNFGWIKLLDKYKKYLNEDLEDLLNKALTDQE